MKKPLVVVIGHTKFLGVPEKLREKGILPTQDQGSEGARLIECAGRTCYDSYGKGRDSVSYHDHIKQVGHGSVIEHVTINFFLSRISRGLTHELVRHRQGCAISQRSTRYVDEAQSDWILHPLLDEALFHPDEELLGTVDSAMASCQHAYELIVERLMEVMVSKGVDKLTARKQARGAARGILGNALETEMVWSANIRALRHVIEMRAADGADAEIRLLANRLLHEARQVVPEYFNDYEEQPASDGFGFSVVTPYRKV